MSVQIPEIQSAPLVAQPPRDVSELYHELLYAVARKFPGESRHETALRYIRDTEERACEAGSCKQNNESPKPKTDTTQPTAQPTDEPPAPSTPPTTPTPNANIKTPRWSCGLNV